jgi:uncharacterized 2Fe-2S/4Fe-4S cluster protein (DUF4445 family)
MTEELVVDFEPLGFRARVAPGTTLMEAARRLWRHRHLWKMPRERFVQVGNAAGMGAKLALVSRRCREIAEEIAHRVEYVELTTHPRFIEVYASALTLSEP